MAAVLAARNYSHSRRRNYKRGKRKRPEVHMMIMQEAEIKAVYGEVRHIRMWAGCLPLPTNPDAYYFSLYRHIQYSPYVQSVRNILYEIVTESKASQQDINIPGRKF